MVPRLLIPPCRLQEFFRGKLDAIAFDLDRLTRKAAELRIYDLARRRPAKENPPAVVLGAVKADVAKRGAFIDRKHPHRITLSLNPNR